MGMCLQAGANSGSTIDSGNTPDRSIQLDPEDWLWATWRSRTPLVRPEAKPFDIDQALTRLEKVLISSVKSSSGRSWERAKIPAAMQPEEAHFWALAMLQARQLALPDLLQQLQTTPLDGNFAWTQIREQSQSRYTRWQYQPICPQIMLPLSFLLPVTELVDLIRDENGDENLSLVDGFRQYVFPYLSESEVEQMRQRLRRQIDWSRYPNSYRLAAVLGLHDEMQSLVSQWSKDSLRTQYFDDVHTAVFGLGDRHQVEYHMRRLNLKLEQPHHIRAWLAHTEYDALDWVRDSILSIKNAKRRKKAAMLLQTFALVNAPEAVRPMLELMTASLAPQVAHQWINEHPVQAIPVLVTLAAGKGAMANTAQRWLFMFRQQGYSDAIQTAIAHLGRSAKVAQTLLHQTQPPDPFDTETSPKWLQALAPARRANELPDWLQPNQLPPIRVGDRCLNEEQVRSLLALLKHHSPQDAPPPLIAALKVNADAASLDAFAWEVFSLWRMNYPPLNSTWGPRIVGWLGGDATAVRIAALIRGYIKAGRRERQWALVLLESLQLMNSDAALIHISTFVQHPLLRSPALEALESAAQLRNLTRDQLENQLVPTLGMNVDGVRRLDFGHRQFDVFVDTDLTLRVMDKDKRVRTTLPRPGVRDDPEMAKRAIAEWTHLKQQLSVTLKQQAQRLEQLMIMGYRWQRQDFETWILQHPVMNRLARLLVWIGYDHTGGAIPFRIAEDGTCADVLDEFLSLKHITQVGIVHPLQLAESERTAWGELLSNYEIIPPFPQIGRSVYALEPSEQDSFELHRFQDRPVFHLALGPNLEKAGWFRTFRIGRGDNYCKPFFSANVTAIAQYSHSWQNNTRTIERCYFVPGIYPVEQVTQSVEAIALNSVDPIVMSEVLKDLGAIAAKSQGAS